MPSYFLIPAIAQAIIFKILEKRKLAYQEALLGSLGGLLNGGATFFLLSATQHANSNEKVILFPLFAVSVILLCNLGGRVFYSEKFHWPSTVLCVSGILIGAMKS